MLFVYVVLRAYKSSLAVEMDDVFNLCASLRECGREIVSLPSHIVPSFIFEDESIVIEFNHAHQVTL